MCMVDDADGYWRCYEEKMVTARKEHTCYECRRPIEIGETYQRAGGLLEDGGSPHLWEHYCTCAHCFAATQWLVVQCGGYLFGGVEEDLRDHWNEEWLLRSIWLGRALIGMRARWRRRDGVLMDVLGEPPRAAVAS